MRINQNIAAFNAYRNLNNTQNQLSSSLEKLSSGFRINRAADDAAGLTNSENLRSQIGGLKVATRNAQDAISLVQTAEGAQTEVHSILQRMRDLTVQSGNLGTNDSNALKANQAEVDKLVQELDRIADETQFGTQQILNSDFEKVAESAGADAVITGGDVGADYETDAISTTFNLTLDGTTEAVSVAYTGAASQDISDLVAEVKSGVDSAFGSGHGITVGNDGDALTFTVAAGDFGSGDEVQTISVEANTDLNLSAASASTELVVDAADVKEGAVFQVGANEGQTVDVGINGVGAGTLGVDSLDIGENATKATIEQALVDLDSAISTVSENRSELGAFQNRMESTIRNLGVAVENLSAAESRIRDTDMAMEMTEFTRNQILSQAGTAMLAQANTVPQSVLSLLG